MPGIDIHDVFKAIVSEWGLIAAPEVQNGRHGYEVRQQFMSGTGARSPELEIQAGGNRPGEVHIGVTGSRHELAAKVRAYLAAHNGGTSRVDVCLDLLADFYEVCGVIERAVTDGRVRKSAKLYQSGSGRTLYLGSEKSEVRLVIYEKGPQQQALGVTDAPPDWVRIEVRIRPKSRWKKAFAQLSLRQLASCRKWVLRCFEALAAHFGRGGRGQRMIVIPEPKRVRTEIETLGYGLDQYKRSAIQLCMDRAAGGDSRLSMIAAGFMGSMQSENFDGATDSLVNLVSAVVADGVRSAVDQGWQDRPTGVIGQSERFNRTLWGAYRTMKNNDGGMYGRTDPHRIVDRMNRAGERRREKKEAADLARLAYAAKRGARFGALACVA